MHVSEHCIFSKLSPRIQCSVATDDHVVGLNDIISKGLAFQWVSSSDTQPSAEKGNAVEEDKTEDHESSDELEELEFTTAKVCNAEGCPMVLTLS